MPNKLTDLIQEFDVPFAFTVHGIEDVTDGPYGPQKLIHLLDPTFTEFLWYLKPDQFSRMFCNQLNQQIVSLSDNVQITKNKPQGKTKWPFYTLMKTNGVVPGVPAPAPAPTAVVPPRPVPVKAVPVAADQALALTDAYKKDREEKEMKDDLRQRGIMIQGYTQSLLEKGMEIVAAKSAGYELAKWTKETALRWQTEEMAKGVFANPRFV